MNNYPLYKRFAMTLNAHQNCLKSGNKEWEEKYGEKLQTYIDELPHGSGIDGKTYLHGNSTPNKLVFYTDYHYMNENGYYDGWYGYKIIVTPSLQNDFDLKIIGKDTPNRAKEYLYEVFQEAFSSIDTESK